MKLSRIFAIIQKEVLLRLRFKFGYIIRSFVEPLKLGLLFFFIYTGFFYAGAKSIGGITGGNYVVFLLLGTMFYNLLYEGFNVLRDSFMNEKYWQTIQGTLSSPATKLDILLGIGLGGLADFIFVFMH